MTGDHMVKGKFAFRKLAAAVLTSVAVTGEDSFTAKGQPYVPGHFHIGYQTDYQGKREGKLLGAKLRFGGFHNLGFLFENKNYGPLNGDDIQRFIGGVEN